MTALKDATDMFMDYIREVDTNDRVGLVIYDASRRQRQTRDRTHHEPRPWSRRSCVNGKPATITTTRTSGPACRTAREHLIAQGRVNAFKMIVLMTDGVANWNNGSYNIAAAKNHVLSEAAADAALNYPVVAISLGAGADTTFMQQVADITESRHFNVPGGAAIGDYREGLMEVFREIADARPMKLVQ